MKKITKIYIIIASIIYTLYAIFITKRYAYIMFIEPFKNITYSDPSGYYPVSEDSGTTEAYVSSGIMLYIIPIIILYAIWKVFLGGSYGFIPCFIITAIFLPISYIFEGTSTISISMIIVFTSWILCMIFNDQIFFFICDLIEKYKQKKEKK